MTLGLVYNARLDSVGVNRRDVNHWKAKFAGQGYVTCQDERSCSKIGCSYKVTIISQTETALTKRSQAKKQEVQKAKGQKTEARDIEQTITAGTVCDPELISEGDVNARYLVSIFEGIAFIS